MPSLKGAFSKHRGPHNKKKGKREADPAHEVVLAAAKKLLKAAYEADGEVIETISIPGHGVKSVRLGAVMNREGGSQFGSATIQVIHVGVAEVREIRPQRRMTNRGPEILKGRIATGVVFHVSKSGKICTAPGKPIDLGVVDIVAMAFTKALIMRKVHKVEHNTSTKEQKKKRPLTPQLLAEAFA